MLGILIKLKASFDRTLKCSSYHERANDKFVTDTVKSFGVLTINIGKWFEPRRLSRLCGLIVRVRVVLRRTVVGDIDRRFDNLSGSHHQSHVNWVTSVYGIYVSGQLSRDVIGCFKSNIG